MPTTDRTKAERIFLQRVCMCPKCGKHDTVEQIGVLKVNCPKHGIEDAKQMQCTADSTIFYCHAKDDKSGKCECPYCKTTPGKGLTEKGREKRPGGDLVKYKCDKCGFETECIDKPEPDSCKCPKCGEKDMKEFEEIDRKPMADGRSFDVTFKCKKCGEEFECILQDGGGKCECPECHTFEADEMSREKVSDSPDGGEIWLVKYKCKKDGTEFECYQQNAKECKCDKCGSKKMKEISRVDNPDGTSVVKFRCEDCGNEFECSEGKCDDDCMCPNCKSVNREEIGRHGEMIRFKCRDCATEYECRQGKEGPGKCPSCGTPVDEDDPKFAKLSERELADGTVVVRYRHDD